MRLSLDLGLGSVATMRGGYTFTNAEAAALVARFTTPPTDARKALIDTLVGSLKTEGVWAELDALYLTAAADSQAARQNWIADQFNLVAVSSPTFTADQGYQGDGVGSYLTTGLAPSAAAKYLQDDAHLSVWSRTNAQSAGVVFGGRTTSGTKQSLLILRNASDLLSHRLNQDTQGLTMASASSTGMFLARRTGAAATDVFKNGALIGTGVVASVTLSATPLFLGALNTGGVAGAFNNYQFAQASVGGTLTDPQVAAFHTAISTYLTAVGAA